MRTVHAAAGESPSASFRGDAGPHPNPAKAAVGQRLHRLEPDSLTSPVVQRIYAEYLRGFGIFAIAQRLTAVGIPSPAAADPVRNSHRCAVAWSKGALRTILINRRYTGRQVWNKQRKQETLIDVDDVALGHTTKLMWNPESSWVVSEELVHPRLVSDEVFEQVQLRLASRGPSTPPESGTRGRHPYALRGLIRCVACGRKMHGAWNRGRAQYRCRFPGEYALANKIEHPLTVYLREDAVLGPLDAWLATALAPASLRAALARSEDLEPSVDPVVDAAHRQLTECDRKPARHRAALEAGADPLVVAEWTNDVQRVRDTAQATLNAARPVERARPLTPHEVTAMIDSLGGLLSVLRQAPANDKCDLYRQLGVSLMYQHEGRIAADSASRSIRLVDKDVGGVAVDARCTRC
jgi:site-specific DNA recombinase